MIALLLAVLSSLSKFAFFQQPQTSPHAHDQAVQARGDHVMGFSHDKTAHHFLLYADAGAIVVAANDATTNKLSSRFAYSCPTFRKSSPTAISRRPCSFTIP